MKEILSVYVSSSTASYGSHAIHLEGDKLSDINLIKLEFDDFHIGQIEYYEYEGVMYKIQNIHGGGKFFRNEYSKEKIKQVAELLQHKYDLKPKSDKYNDIIDLVIKKDNIVTEKELQDKGYVNWKVYPNKHTPKEMIGGFDLEVIFVEQLISYIEKGLCFGYIGHPARKVWVDKLISELCLPVIPIEAFACWLTSTDGRHFMNSIKPFIVNDDVNEVKKVIESKLNNIHDKAIIYNSPEHKGNLNSTIELFEKYKDMGLMLSDKIY